ncbi:SixA phosphatase family protein [Geodermatophilus marinus]|uniref:SixA phosphatase family protein n=1 Tax=Geodermatophilus sp. LHW52908 TaxID=2303986 RepID=UPI000E3D77AF|nr:histidine phosphatase family protein [Geodermatophilus sp. LHW52908]RFU22931.1 phosphohistidine phosphatase [Geodermatophilus sp. LHW52908]
MQPRRLLLVRHAEAASAPVDADRPLTPRGERQAAAIGSWLAAAGLVPDRVLVSPARRALQTWERAAAALPAGAPPTVDGRVHDNTVEALLGAVRETGDDVRTLAVVGHNPSVGELVRVLDDGRGDPAARQDAAAGFPTGTVAVLEVGASFAATGPGGATLHEVAVPGR